MVSSTPTSQITLDGQPAVLVRTVGWLTLAFLVAFLINNILLLGFEIPSGREFFSDPSIKNLIQPLVYVLSFLSIIYWVNKTPDRTLRRDADQITNFNTYFIRACFFSVLFVGVVDASIAWMRVESLLPVLFNEATASALLRSSFIGPMIHVPLIILGFIVALFSRTLGFFWLALMIVGAELLIVISRFVFSYEQSLMGDLVRYWYAALFLFASAYTLLQEGHVRVDILYSGFNSRKKGKVNAYGSIFLGMMTAITIILICLWSKQAIVNSPVMNFEVTQTGTAGMYTKYQMAAFLLIFAITMQIQFVSSFLEAVADIRNEPGKREVAPISH
ncbi:MAG: TRAP transporter small permease subunit [Paracoccaceae bacterium]|jgi:TRAP-type mannitol/chloroaromatic compound transport system permease small subunit|nr:TRAP transporter small permease subunit [Paracoccaceae bacterium]